MNDVPKIEIQSAVPYNAENSAKMREVGETIQGTCKSLDDVLQEVFGDEELTMTDFDIRLLGELDDITQECQVCGWWCETCELNDEQVCGDCAADD